MNPKAIGERTEGIVLGHLMKLGHVVLLPFGNNQRYDIVIDVAGRFVRGQCKTGRLKNGCITFWACSTNGFLKKKTGYRGQIEVFWVYCPENGKVYQVPVDKVGQTQVALRVAPPKDRRIKTIRWASEFEI